MTLELKDQDKLRKALHESLRFSRRKHNMIAFFFLLLAVSVSFFVPPVFSAWVLWLGKVVGLLFLVSGAAIYMWARKQFSADPKVLEDLFSSPEKVVWIYLAPEHLQARPNKATARGNIFLGFQDGSRFAFPLLFVEMEDIVNLIVQQCPTAYSGYEETVEEAFLKEPISLLPMAKEQ